jgi:hypothetical protein
MPIAAALRRRATGQTSPGAEAPAIVVIIPAHDMASHIGRSLEALQSDGYPQDRLILVVAADHCSDETAALSRARGAKVLERQDGPAGKTYTIAWALEQLRAAGVNANLYVVTDGTAWVKPGFLAGLAARRMAGEDIVVARSIAATEGQPWFIHCLGLTLVHRNFQNECRERLGLSSLIEGRGMAYSDSYVARHGWTLALPPGAPAHAHPTEDWRHGVRVVEEGYRVAFAGDAWVMTPLRGSLSAATAQGARWEQGRMANAMTHGLRVLGAGLREMNARRIFAGLDAIQLPVAILGALAALIAATAVIWPVRPWVDLLAMLPLTCIAVYGLVVTSKGREVGIRPQTVAWAPVYIAWRSISFVLGLIRR